MRAKLVRGSTLAEIAREIDLGAAVRVGSGELKSGGRNRDSILADALEAVIGAIHEDSAGEHGVALVEQIILELYRERLVEISVADLKDAKTQLQEHLQQHQLPLPEYRVVGSEGEDHQRIYTVECRVADLEVSRQAQASSRRKAEKASAQQVLDYLRRQPGAHGS